MIGDAILGKVVGADFLAAIASADLATAGIALLLGAFFFSELEEARTEFFHGLFLVLDLRLLVLAADDQAARHMGDAHRAVSGVDRLPAGPGRTESIDAQIGRIDSYFHILDLRQDGYGSGGSVDAAGFFRFRNALDAMDAGFGLHFLIDGSLAFAAVYLKNRLFESADFGLVGVEHDDVPALFFGKV